MPNFSYSANKKKYNNLNIVNPQNNFYLRVIFSANTHASKNIDGS